MALYWICVIALLGIVVSGDDSCPTPAEIKPCTCDGEGFNCNNARTSDDVKKAFQAKFKYGAMRSVWIAGSEITSLPANTFGNIKCLAFYIEANKIQAVDVRAFSASNKTLHTLSLYGNEIDDFDFGGLSIFEKLSTLNLGDNFIETIPDDAFNSRSLSTIILSKNQISHIGMNAFSNLPNLLKLEMPSNQIVTLGPKSLALKSSLQVQINLSYNQISKVSSSAFSGLVNTVDLTKNQLKTLKKNSFKALLKALLDIGGKVKVGENPFSCDGCDFEWLVNNKDNYVRVLENFMCEDGTELKDLTDSYIGC